MPTSTAAGRRACSPLDPSILRRPGQATAAYGDRGRVDVSPPPGGTAPGPSPRAGARAQGPLQGLGVREPLGRVLGQAPQHDALQVLGDAGADPRRGHHRVAGVRDQHRDPARPPRTAAGRSAGSRPPPPASRCRSARRAPGRAVACSGDMNSGVPRIWPSRLRSAAPDRRRGQDQAEVEQLGHVVHAPAPRGEDVRRLDVAVDQARRVRLAQRPADLPQQVDHPRRAAAGRGARPARPGSGPAGTP